MRVLFLSPIGTLGGAEEGLLDLLASLRRTGPQIDAEVLALDHGPLIDEAAKLGARTDVLPLPPSLARIGESGGLGGLSRGALAAGALLGWLPRLANVLRKKRPDVIHSNGLKTHLLAAVGKPAGIPLIWHLHDFLSARVMTSRVLPRLQGRAAIGIGVSEAVTRDARKVLPRLRLETVLNGVRTERFSPGRVPPADLDALAQLSRAPSDTVRLGLVATYASWKGHQVFLDAASRVDAEASRFYIVGGPVYSTRGSQVTAGDLRARIAQLGLQSRCGLVPHQKQIENVYAGLDIIVNASTRPEPFGRTVAEAMASGRSVIAAGTGGVLEQVEHGINGLLFEPGNPIGLTEQMNLLISSPELRAKLQAGAIARARLYLDAARLGPLMAGLYRSLCGVESHEPNAR